MVVHQDHPLFIEDLFGPGLLKGPDGQGRGDVVGQGDIHLGQDQLSRFHVFFAAMGGEDFLGNCLWFAHRHFTP